MNPRRKIVAFGLLEYLYKFIRSYNQILTILDIKHDSDTRRQILIKNVSQISVGNTIEEFFDNEQFCSEAY